MAGRAARGCVPHSEWGGAVEMRRKGGGWWEQEKRGCGWAGTTMGKDGRLSEQGLGSRLLADLDSDSALESRLSDMSEMGQAQEAAVAVDEGVAGGGSARARMSEMWTRASAWSLSETKRP
jgi:hypothetical protein